MDGWIRYCCRRLEVVTVAAVAVEVDGGDKDDEKAVVVLLFVACVNSGRSES